MRKTVLVIDNDESTCQTIECLFCKYAAEVQCVYSIDEGLKRFYLYTYCLVIINVLLLDSCGFPLLNIMRKSKNTPILALAAKDMQFDKVSILNSGADGFLVKPFCDAECIAIADALIRRYIEADKQNTDDYPLKLGQRIIIDPQCRLVIVDGLHLDLTRKEYEILYLLGKRPLQVFSREQIVDCIWDMNSFFNIDDTVRFHIQNLRRKLRLAIRNDQDCIETVWGVGYRFNPGALPNQSQNQK